MIYCDFYVKLIGWEFRRKLDGCIVGKCGLWNKYIDDEVSLQQLMDGTHPDYDRNEKDNFKEGQYVGELEASSAVRRYRLCPEKKVRKKREPNFKD